jgi:hypothetical protein
MRLQRQVVATIAIASLLTLAGCAGTLASGTSAPVGDRTVTVAADGTVEVAPDRATVRVGVVETGGNVSAVRERLAATSDGMREALESAGYDVTSAYFDIDRNYYETRPRDVPEFVGRHVFVIRVADPAAAGDAIVTAVENGASEIEEVTFGVSDATRRDLRTDALAAAMTNARADAEAIAEEGGLRITGVDAATTAPIDVSPVVRQEVAYAAGDAAAGGTPTRLDAGNVTVHAHVVVTYNATSA